MKTFLTSRQWAMGMTAIFLLGILFAAVNYGCSRGCSQQEAEQKQSSAVTGSIPDTASEEQAGVSETEDKVLVARTETEDQAVVTDSSSENRIIDTGTAPGTQAGAASSLQPPAAKRRVAGAALAGSATAAKTAPEPRGAVAWAAPGDKGSESPGSEVPGSEVEGSDVGDSEVSDPEPQAVAAAPPPPPVFAQQAAADTQGPPAIMTPGCYKKILGEDAGIYQNFKEGHSANASEWQYVGPNCELDNMGPGCYKRLHGEKNEVVYQYFKHGRPASASGWTWIGYCCGSYGQ